MKTSESNSPSSALQEPPPALAAMKPSPYWRAILGLGLSFALFPFTNNLQAQTVSDDFNDGNDTGWSPYEGNAGTRETQFPSDGAGGHYYQLINHASRDESGIFTRGASIRNDANYPDQFFLATDVITWNDTAMVGAAGT